jgi:hypothetical protein
MAGVGPPELENPAQSLSGVLDDLETLLDQVVASPVDAAGPRGR